MDIPTIGWSGASPVPEGHAFNRYLRAQDGRLWMDGVDLMGLFSHKSPSGRKISSPLEVVYLPAIRDKIHDMVASFDRAIRETNYTGKFLYAYASKANAAEEVVRTVLSSGAHYEISSWIDVEIFRHMRAKGHAPGERWVLCNGFKQSGSLYSQKIIELQREYPHLLPVLEDAIELPALIEAGLHFDLGLRLKSYGAHDDLNAMDAANSRFGMPTQDLIAAARQIAAAPHLDFRLLHAMVGSQITGEEDFVVRLYPAIEFYAQLRQEFETLDMFDFGGGVPVGMALDFQFDYAHFARLLMEAFQRVCGKKGVPVPHIVGEMGRYTVTEHGAHIFKVLSVKQNGSKLPWYIIDGSIMSSFPDTWCLGEHFAVLAVNHLDGPFQQVQLGGITCDSDDVYPPKPSHSPLYLPVNTDDLYVGFFNIGAYQEMLGGVGGSKHCVIPEANELVIDQDNGGQIIYEKIPGQSAADVLHNLGYR